MRRTLFFAGNGNREFGERFHLRRCIEIASELRGRGNQSIEFICPVGFNDEIHDAGFRALNLDISDMNQMAANFEEHGVSVGIIDMGVAPAALPMMLRGIGALVVLMDDSGPAGCYADIAIDSYLPDSKAFFHGQEYWVPNRWWAEAGKPESIGDTVALNLTAASLPHARKLADLVSRLEVLGHKVSPVLAPWAASEISGLPFKVETDPERVRQTVNSSKAVINAGIADLFDLVVTGRPMIAIVENDEDEKLISGLREKNGVIYSGAMGSSSVEELAGSVHEALANTDFLLMTAEAGISIVTEKNLQNVCDIIEVVKVLSWDSDFFGFPVAYLSCGKLRPVIMQHVLEFSKNNKVRVLEYLCNCHDRESVMLAEEHHFHFADIRLTFERNLDNLAEPPSLPEGYSFGLATEEDIDALTGIADGIYLDSRYYFDSRFPRDKVKVFYQDWLRKSVLGTFDDRTYVVRSGSEPVGFCTIKFRPFQSAGIGLVGLDRKYASRGLGSRLVLNTLAAIAEEGVTKVFVVTQGRNYAAQRLYQKCGFITKSTELWYHKWFF